MCGRHQVGSISFLDRAERLIYVVGAVDIDGPRTENALRGMAAQVRELPPLSAVTRSVRSAIAATLSIGEKPAAWLQQWETLSGPASGPGTSGVCMTNEPIPFEVHGSGALFHGTKADLEVGDLLEPGRDSNYGA